MGGAPHVELTAAEPRQPDLHVTSIRNFIQPPFLDVRLIKLRTNGSVGKHVEFLPGQWVDVHLPGVDKVGGFSITSTPKDAREHHILQLAVQKSEKNPPANWFWQDANVLMEQKPVRIRVGGSFTWPPPDIDMTSIKRVVFIAGGVGINPLISMLRHIHETGANEVPELYFLYSHRMPQVVDEYDPSKFSLSPNSILFLPRIVELFSTPPFSSKRNKYQARLQLTRPKGTRSEIMSEEEWARKHKQKQRETGEWFDSPEAPVKTEFGRITPRNLQLAIDGAGGKKLRKHALIYVCGPRDFTDWAVEEVRSIPGVVKEHVLCEKWW